MTSAYVSTSELVSAWPVESGECFVQTLSPETAAKVSCWKGARIVARSVAGGFLRVHSIPRPIDRLEPLVDRMNARYACS